MKSISLRAFFLAATFFSFSAAFAQDSPKTPKPDTSKMPKHDTTGMSNYQMRSLKVNNDLNVIALKDINVIPSFIMKNEDKPVAKKESAN